MTTTDDSAAREKQDRASYSAIGVRCPRCGGSLDRIMPRLMDRATSLFTHTRRYLCWNGNCRWEGNLRHVAPAKP